MTNPLATKIAALQDRFERSRKELFNLVRLSNESANAIDAAVEEMRGLGEALQEIQQAFTDASDPVQPVVVVEPDSFSSYVPSGTEPAGLEEAPLVKKYVLQPFGEREEKRVEADDNARRATLAGKTIKLLTEGDKNCVHIWTAGVCTKCKEQAPEPMKDYCKHDVSRESCQFCRTPPPVPKQKPAVGWDAIDEKVGPDPRDEAEEVLEEAEAKRPRDRFVQKMREWWDEHKRLSPKQLAALRRCCGYEEAASPALPDDPHMPEVF